MRKMDNGLFLSNKEVDKLSILVRLDLFKQAGISNTTSVCSDKREQTLREMNPDLYDFVAQMQRAIF